MEEFIRVAKTKALISFAITGLQIVDFHMRWLEYTGKYFFL